VFYGEIFSTLSKLIVHRNISAQSISTDYIYFSYPQCNLIQKHHVLGPVLDRAVYTVPDFAFLRAKIAYSADGAPKVEQESAVFLTEIKRLYDDSLSKLENPIYGHG